VFFDIIDTRLDGRTTSATGADETPYVAGSYKEETTILALLGNLYRFMESTRRPFYSIVFNVVNFVGYVKVAAWPLNSMTNFSAAMCSCS
jgi:hypothetical protein